MAEEGNDGTQNGGNENQQSQGSTERFLNPLETLKAWGSNSQTLADFEKNQTQNQGTGTDTGKKNDQQNSENQNGAAGTEASNNEGTQQPGSENAEGTKKSETKEPEIKSVLGINKKKDPVTNPVVIEDANQLLGEIKTNFGMELKDIKETPKFFESVKKWRGDSQKLQEVETNLENFKKVISTLDDTLFTAVQLYHQGKDYREALKPAAFDYSKKVDDQDLKSLVNHYFPGKFTDEDFKEETAPPALEIAQEAAKEKYNNEKQTIDNNKRAVQENAKKQLELQKQSLKSSVDYLKKSFPDTEEDVVKDVSTILEGGPQSLVAFFYNKDGSLKPEAAEMLLMAKHGKSEIQNMMIRAAHIAETKLNEDLISRSASKPEQKNNGAGKQEVSPEVQKQIKDLANVRNLRKKTF